MPREAELPDGTVLEFPDDATDGQISAGAKRFLAKREQLRTTTISQQYAPAFGKVGAYVAKEAPKAIGAAAGTTAAVGLAQPELILPFAMGGAALGEGMRQGLSKLFNTPDAPPNVSEALKGIVSAGLEGATQEAGPAYRAMKFAQNPALKAAVEMGTSISPNAARAGEFKVPLTPAQESQGAVLSAIEGFLRKTIGGQQVFLKYDLKAKNAIAKAAEEMKLFFSGRNLSQREWGQAVQGAIDSYTKPFGEAYEQALGQIVSSKGGKIPLDIEAMKKPMKKLLDQFTVASDYAKVLQGPLGGEFKHAQKILGELSTTTKKVATEEGTEMVPKVLTFSDALKLRKVLFAMSHSGQTSEVKGALKQANKALDEAMGKALKDAGLEAQYTAWHKASSNYHSAMQVMDDALIKEIQNKAAPEEIAKAILASGTESKLRLLARVAPELRNDTSAALFAQAYETASKEGTLLGDSISRILGYEGGGKVPREALRVAFPGNSADKLQRFINMVDNVHLRASALKPMSAQSLPLIAQSALGGASLVGGTMAVLQPDGQGGMWLAGTGLAASLLAPAAFAKLFTNPRITDMAIQAMKIRADSAAGKILASRLANALTAESVAPDEIPPAPPSINAAMQKYPTVKELEP